MKLPSFARKSYYDINYTHDLRNESYVRLAIDKVHTLVYSLKDKHAVAVISNVMCQDANLKRKRYKELKTLFAEIRTASREKLSELISTNKANILNIFNESN